MNIAKIILKYRLFQEKKPFTLKELEEFVNQNSNRNYSKAAIRNVFMSPYYNFGYHTFSRGLYAPTNIKSIEDLAGNVFGSKVLPIWTTLFEDKKLTSQNFSKNYFVAFGKPWTLKFNNIILENNTYYFFPSAFEKYYKYLEDLMLVKNFGNSVELKPKLNFSYKQLLDFFTKTYPRVHNQMIEQSDVLTKSINISELDKATQSKIFPSPKDYELLGKLYDWSKNEK